MKAVKAPGASMRANVSVNVLCKKKKKTGTPSLLLEGIKADVTMYTNGKRNKKKINEAGRVSAAA